MGVSSLNHPAGIDLIINPQKKGKESEEWIREMWDKKDVTHCHWFWRGGRGPWVRRSSSLQGLEKASQQIPLESLQKEHNPANTLILAQETHIGIPTYETVRWWIYVVVICCGSNRKWLRAHPAYLQENKVVRTATVEPSFWPEITLLPLVGFISLNRLLTSLWLDFFICKTGLIRVPIS